MVVEIPVKRSVTCLYLWAYNDLMYLKHTSMGGFRATLADICVDRGCRFGMLAVVLCNFNAYIITLLYVLSSEYDVPN